MKTPPDLILLSGHPDERFNGEVKYRLTKVYDRVGIASRTAQLRNGLAPQSFSFAENKLFEIIATLEYVIETAPKGFYLSDTGKDAPEVSPVLNLAFVDEDTLVEVYQAWEAFNRFHYYPKRRFARDDQEPISPSSVDSSDANGAEPV